MFMCPKKLSGGPGTFKDNIEQFLYSKNIQILHPESKIKPDIVFVISATRHFFTLIKFKIIGIKIIQRLDGINWMHKHRTTGLKNFLKSELINLQMNFIRKWIADKVVYQSDYVRQVWDDRYGKINHSLIIHNGSRRVIEDKNIIQSNEYVLTSVEGTIQDDNFTKNLISAISKSIDRNSKIKKFELYGDCSEKMKKELSNHKVVFFGNVNRNQILNLYRDNHQRIFFMLEINPACPNSLIEALVNETPAIGYDMGSFKEIIQNCGIAIKYKGNPEKYELANFNEISRSLEKIIASYNSFKENCNKNHKELSLDAMNEKYFNLFKSIS